MRLKLFGWEIELRKETRLEELERVRAAWLKQEEERYRHHRDVEEREAKP